jgi:hypothetical protein
MSVLTIKTNCARLFERLLPAELGLLLGDTYAPDGRLVARKFGRRDRAEFRPNSVFAAKRLG